MKPALKPAMKLDAMKTSNRLVLVAFVLCLALPTLAACGKKADLDPPPGAPKERTYPKPN